MVLCDEAMTLTVLDVLAHPVSVDVWAVVRPPNKAPNTRHKARVVNIVNLVNTIVINGGGGKEGEGNNANMA